MKGFDEVGELQARGFNTLLRYAKAPTQTADSKDPKTGWFKTGDLAVILPNGHCKVPHSLFFLQDADARKSLKTIGKK